MTTARLAGFVTRLLAFVIDVVILNIVTIVLGGAIAWVGRVIGVEVDPSTPVLAGLAATSWLVCISLYLVVFWSLAGQTPGMRYLGIRVVDLRGCEPGFTRSVRRLGGMYLAALPLGAGFLLILVDERRRGLQDRIARTLVVHDAPAGSPASEPVLRVPVAAGTRAQPIADPGRQAPESL